MAFWNSNWSFGVFWTNIFIILIFPKQRLIQYSGIKADWKNTDRQEMEVEVEMEMEMEVKMKFMEVEVLAFMIACLWLVKSSLVIIG